MFDTEKFILVIQKKECIWNIHNADYRNRGKRQCWQEVCQEMYPDWEKKSASEKREKGKRIVGVVIFIISVQTV
jgi:hypothetical protein